MKKIVLQVCLAALLALPALPCLALGRKQFLYRIDSRPPEVVFAEGFTAPGANLDLMNHYSWLFARGHGESSGFIDLVGDEESAISLMSMAPVRAVEARVSISLTACCAALMKPPKA